MNDITFCCEQNGLFNPPNDIKATTNKTALVLVSAHNVHVQR